MLINVSLSEKSIDAAIKKLDAYQKKLERRANELCRRLALLGATRATIDFSQAIYTGEKDFSITVDKTKDGYVVKADGESILFLEFGAGIRYGYGHPLATQFQMGPGTYPGKGHWDDPKGWWIPKDKVESGTSDRGRHTYGNPPAMPMFNAAQDMRRSIKMIAEEVFRS